MNLSTIKTAVMDFGWKASRKLNQYSPEIAFGLGVICFGKTIYEATKAGPALDSVTLKAQEKMALVKKVAEENEEYAAEDAKKDKLAIMVATAKDFTVAYGKVFVWSGLTLASFLCSYRILSNRNAALIAAYATLEQGFKKYRTRVAGAIGEEKENALYDGLKEKTVTRTVVGEDGKKKKVKEKLWERSTDHVVSPYAVYFDKGSIYFQRDEIVDEETGVVIGYVGNDAENKRILTMVEKWANDTLQSRYLSNPNKPGYLYLDEIYHKLGIDVDNQAARFCGWGYDPDRPDLFANGVMITNIDIDPEGGMLIDFNVDGPVAFNLQKYWDPEIDNEAIDE